MLKKMEFQDIDQVAAVHKEELPGFLSELGEVFLKKFYKSSFSIPEMFTIVEVKNGQILGFASGVAKLAGLYKKILLKDPLGFIIAFLSYFITHPGGIVRLMRTMVYPGFASDIPELLTIAIVKKWQGKGIGRKLFREVAREFKVRGVKSFRVSVYDRLPANEFYKKVDCRFEKSFDFMGEKMNYYIYEIQSSNVKSNPKSK